MNMYFQVDLCCLCLKYLKLEYKSLSERCEQSLSYYEKLKETLPQFLFPAESITFEYKLCLKCCDKLNSFYDFSTQCIKNLNILQEYKKKLTLSQSDTQQAKLVIDISKNTENTLNEAIKLETEIKDEPNDTSYNFYDENSAALENINVILAHSDDEDQKVFLLLPNISENSITTECIQLKDEPEIENEDVYENKTEIETLWVKAGDENLISEDNSNDVIFVESDDENELSNQNIVCKSEPSEESSSPSKTKDPRLAEFDSPKVIKRKLYSCEYSSLNKKIHKTQIKLTEKETHIADKLFKCDKCDKYFNDKEILDSHALVHILNPKFYFCNLCNIRFIQKVNYDYHNKTFHGEKKNEKKIRIPRLKPKVDKPQTPVSILPKNTTFIVLEKQDKSSTNILLKNSETQKSEQKSERERCSKKSKNQVLPEGQPTSQKSHETKKIVFSQIPSTSAGKVTVAKPNREPLQCKNKILRQNVISGASSSVSSPNLIAPKSSVTIKQPEPSTRQIITQNAALLGSLVQNVDPKNNIQAPLLHYSVSQSSVASTVQTISQTQTIPTILNHQVPIQVPLASNDCVSNQFSYQQILSNGIISQVIGGFPATPFTQEPVVSVVKETSQVSKRSQEKIIFKAALIPERPTQDTNKNQKFKGPRPILPKGAKPSENDPKESDSSNKQVPVSQQSPQLQQVSQVNQQVPVVSQQPIFTQVVSQSSIVSSMMTPQAQLVSQSPIVSSVITAPQGQMISQNSLVPSVLSTHQGQVLSQNPIVSSVMAAPQGQILSQNQLVSSVMTAAPQGQIFSQMPVVSQGQVISQVPGSVMPNLLYYYT